MNKDWKGNKHSVFSTLGASNHSDTDREKYDYYATPKEAVECLLKEETFSHKIWEPACGEGAISNVLLQHHYDVRSSDIVERKYPCEQKDFLFFNNDKWEGDIITNPPYAMSKEFTLQAMKCIKEGAKLAMLLRLQFLEGIDRGDMFKKYPPYTFLCRVKDSLRAQ